MPNAIIVNHFDPHIHSRRRPMMDVVLPQAAERMCGGVEEPNTNPHLLTCDDVERHLDESRLIAPDRAWSASIYLTPDTSLKEVQKAWDRGLIAHVKSYPPRGTTFSSKGVRPEQLLDINSSAGKVLCGLAEAGIPFKNHGEIVHKDGQEIHPQYRESVWYQEYQPHFDDIYRTRGLRHIHAHITTKDAADYMRVNGDPMYRICEITGHHLVQDWTIQYNDGFLLPDCHWLPVSKPYIHWNAIRQLVVDRLSCLVAASDMAAHNTEGKYTRCVYGGGYTYHCSLELFIQVLEDLGVLEFAEDFLYGNAKRFHGKLVPDNPTPFWLRREGWTVSSRVKYEDGEMTPFGYAEEPKDRFLFRWKLIT